jgi:sulfoquinovosidase
MLDLKPHNDGFRIDFQGRGIMEHTRKHPCLALYSLVEPRLTRGGLMHARVKALAHIKAGAWKAIEKRPDFVELEFEGLGRMALRARDAMLTMSFSRYDASFNGLCVRLLAIAGETAFGGGERYAGKNIKGRRVQCDPRVQGGRSQATSPGSMGNASLLSDGRTLITVDCAAPVCFDLRKGRWTLIETWAIPREIVLHAAPSITALIASAALKRNAGIETPAWTMDGICLTVSGGGAEVSRRIHKALDSGIRLSSVLVRDWQGRSRDKRTTLHSWLPDRLAYPRLEEDCAHYLQAGLRIAVPFDPALSRESPLYEEAKPYLLPSEKELVLPDLWKPEAFAWVKEQLRKRLLGIGISAWLSATGAGPVLERACGNEFAELWSKACRQAIREDAAEARAAFFVRSGWGDGAQLANGMYSPWGVDKRSRGDDKVLSRGIFMGLCPGGSWHGEIRSTGIRSLAGREAFMRRVEAAAIGPLMRIGDEEPYWNDKGIMDHLARMSRFWTALKPYHAAVADEYRSAGLPPLRHPALHYPDEALLSGGTERYLYGRDLLAAPVVKLGSDLQDILLPDDRWIHLWSSREFRGGDITIEAALGSPALFYRADSAWAGLFDSLRRALTRFEDPLR